MESEDLSFLGTGWSFPPEFFQEKTGSNRVSEVKMTSGFEDINNSLHIIFSTRLGERVMRPTFGSDLFSQVFESITVQMLTQIRAMITEAIIYHEPRIKLNGIEIIPDELTGIIHIKIEYTVITINTRYNYVFPFYFNEGTNLIR